ncbi:MAG TPA: DUF1990 family protein [Solirubrobacterales bacterium]
MPAEQSLRRRWGTAARWPVGVGLASWRYVWSTTPVHRWELTGSWAEDAPPDLPPETRIEDLQLPEDGSGPLIHRIYRTRIVGSPISAGELMARMTGNLDSAAPSEFATFQKLRGEKGRLRVGDEYVVRMPGPWDGPVRVVAVDSSSFRLATLPDHLEAGQIEFRAASDYRSISFEIESWARSGDRLSDLMYSRLRISKEVQLHMWASVLRGVVDLSAGKMEGGIVITTRLVDAELLPLPGTDEPPARSLPPQLSALAEREVNFDASRVDEFVGDAGWRNDDLVEPLPHEGSGPPEDGGSWEVGRKIMDSYQLADPRIVTATYDTDAPLAGRDMLLRIHFLGLGFDVAVRIGDVYEEDLEIDGRTARVFGWDYRTLDGHFEQGQMHYEIWKWLDTGDVEFHLRAVSRPARSGPFFLRTGFRLVGRPNQLRFYRQICRRMRRLTEAQLETNRAVRERRKESVV